MRRQLHGCQPLQTLQPKTLELLIETDPFRRSEGPLAAPSQMPRETVRYSHLGANGLPPCYGELARVMAGGFAVDCVVNTSHGRSENLVEVVEKVGGGARTRTADLGIMRPSL